MTYKFRYSQKMKSLKKYIIGKLLDDFEYLRSKRTNLAYFPQLSPMLSHMKMTAKARSFRWHRSRWQDRARCELFYTICKVIQQKTQQNHGKTQFRPFLNNIWSS
jgi:hypothetical protein